VYLGSLVPTELNHDTTVAGVALRYALTPLTTIVLDVNRAADRFAIARERDAETLSVMPSLVFRPDGVLSGSISIGRRFRHFASALGDYPSTAVAVNLNYIAFGQTQFNFAAGRDLEYSYRADVPQYLQTSWGGSVTERLGDIWDVGAGLSRLRLAYQLPEALSGSPAQTESTWAYSGQVGFRVRRNRIGLDLQYRTRDAGWALYRSYNRFRIATSITATF
jgi:hypothetical protein